MEEGGRAEGGEPFGTMGETSSCSRRVESEGAVLSEKVSKEARRHQAEEKKAEEEVAMERELLESLGPEFLVVLEVKKELETKAAEEHRLAEAKAEAERARLIAKECAAVQAARAKHDGVRRQKC